MSNQPPVNLEEQTNNLASASFKYTMYIVFGFIIVAAYITINTDINEDLVPKVSPSDEGHGGKGHGGKKDSH